MLKENHFAPELVTKLLTFLETSSNELEVVVCGVKSAYVLKNASQRFKDFSALYYFRLAELTSFDDLPADRIVKFALDVPVDQAPKIIDQLNAVFQEEITAVSSGYGSIDIIIPGITKGNAIQCLLADWGIEHNELAAFGDADNELEMLAMTDYSYAMQESSPAVLATAKNQAPSNNEAGVLQVIEKILE